MWEAANTAGRTAEAAANTAGCIAAAANTATSSIIAGLKLFRILI